MVARVVDGRKIRSDRPYRAGMAHEDCLAILQKEAAGGGLDPELVAVFCALGAELAPVTAPAKSGHFSRNATETALNSTC